MCDSLGSKVNHWISMPAHCKQTGYISTEAITMSRRSCTSFRQKIMLKLQTNTIIVSGDPLPRYASVFCPTVTYTLEPFGNFDITP